jgi:Icc-related predicted phosphoesterase
MTRLVLISDTHCRHPEIPNGDILFHSGDLTISGNRAETEAEVRWLGEVAKEFKWVILIGGNHDFFFQHAGARTTRQFIQQFGAENIIYLCDESVTVENLNIYGSPWQPWFMGWAWNAQRGADIRKYWDRIPTGLDVLLSHGPPHGILDWVGQRRVGCEELGIAINRVKPRLHSFGHIHSAGGQTRKFGDTQCYNASVVDETYALAYNPHVVEI